MTNKKPWEDLSWVTTTGRKPVEQMSIDELMGPCPSCGGYYDRRGECNGCGSTVSPQQVAKRRQWLKDHPGQEDEE